MTTALALPALLVYHHFQPTPWPFFPIHTQQHHYIPTKRCNVWLKNNNWASSSPPHSPTQPAATWPFFTPYEQLHSKLERESLPRNISRTFYWKSSVLDQDIAIWILTRLTTTFTCPTHNYAIIFSPHIINYTPATLEGVTIPRISCDILFKWFIQSFQVSVFRHAQSNLKNWDSYISKMNLGMKLLHLFDCGQVHLGRSKVIPVLNMLYVKTELSYKTDVLHMDRLP